MNNRCWTYRVQAQVKNNKKSRGETVAKTTLTSKTEFSIARDSMSCIARTRTDTSSRTLARQVELRAAFPERIAGTGG